ncbi:hypothetical protein RIF23_14860 [Lipingzhangella sp. LS1_29]|uniref:Uncharacterized protein n=1 Tax=Lipingzhangella rawalii TaxID=2055835 RepID=A0ABU2H8F0_9ACTN|nr:hypothetical protein [Lipingzhangella rawalii]MDS1271574.1 hypothetical protein [Lipingzhangella rawalii]
MSDKVRLVCPVGRKRAATWSGGGALAVGAVVLALSPASVPNQIGAVLCGAAGIVLLVLGMRYHTPVLEVDAAEFRYTRGRYIVRIPFSEVGSYFLVDGQTRSLGLCDPAGRPRVFPSVEGRRARRPYLPLTRSVSRRAVGEFMEMAGIPPRERSLRSGA